VERCIEEDISVRVVRIDEVEWSVASRDDGNGARDEGFTVEVAEVISIAKNVDLGFYNREKLFAVGLEVYEEDESLVWIFVEDAIASFGAIDEVG